MLRNPERKTTNAGTAASMGARLKSVALRATGKNRNLVAGLKPQKYVLPLYFSSTNTASGVCASIAPVDVSQSSEFLTDLGDLYDEYRFLRGWLMFWIVAPANIQSSDGAFAIGYDPSDSTVPSGCVNVGQLSQSQMYSGEFANNGAGVLVSNGIFRTDGKLHRFDFKPPKGTQMALDNSGNIILTPGSWKKIASVAANYDGFLKVYYANTSANSAITCSGFIYFEVEVRSRK